MIVILILSKRLGDIQDEAIKNKKDPYNEVFIRCQKGSNGFKLEVNDDKGLLGQIFEILHIICVMTMAV